MTVLLIIGSVLVVFGVIGSFIPGIPGPIFSFAGLVCLYFGLPGSISQLSLLLFGIALAVLTFLNYSIPVLSTRFSGATKNGLIGAIAGSLIGIFFSPLGMLFGAFFGAFLGELSAGKEPLKAVKAGVGTLLGNVSVMILQILFSLSQAVYFFIKLFSH
jgi:uncharacterized protein YqgC (DUF456 family)